MTDHPTDDHPDEEPKNDPTMHDDTDTIHEQQIRGALAAIAEAPGAPDDLAAWDAVRGRIERQPEQRRRRALVGLSGLAAAAAAVVGFLVLTDGDDDQPVEVGPSDTPTTVEGSPTTTIPGTSTTATPATDFPAHPIAVVAGTDPARLDLYDGDTGALVTRGLATSYHSLSEVSFGADGTVYFTEEFGDSYTVRAVPWDGSAAPVTPFEADSETRSPALSPDGRTFAYVHQGVTTDGGEIVLVDTATGDRRALRWAPDEQDFFHTNGWINGLEWSPDGTRLLFVSAYEGNEVLVIDPAAASLSEATVVPDLGAFHAHWSGPDEVLGLHECCYPEFSDPIELRRVVLPDGDPTTVDLGEVLDFDVASDGRIAVVRPGGAVEVIQPDGTIVPLETEGPSLDVGL